LIISCLRENLKLFNLNQLEKSNIEEPYLLRGYAKLSTREEINQLITEFKDLLI